MAIIGGDQITLVDLTDGYSVILTSDSYTFLGGTNAAKAGNTTTQIVVMCGATQVPCSVVLSEIVKPAGVTVTSDNNATSPTLTIAVTTSVKEAGNIDIPVHIGDITIHKTFSFGIAFTGSKGDNGDSVTVENITTTYGVSNSATAEPTTWVSDKTQAVAKAGQYFWTKTVFTFSDGTVSEPTYSYALQGETGEKGDSITVNVETTYGSSANATTKPTSWSATIPTVPEGSYLWTKTVNTYSDGTKAEQFTYAKQGAKGDKGDKGDDAIVVKVISSNGDIFKNTVVNTVLTAHVYRGGVELTEDEIAKLGTIKWFKDGGTTAVATGVTYTIDAGDVASRATFDAKLDDGK